MTFRDPPNESDVILKTQGRSMNAWVWVSSSSCVPPVETQVVSIVPPGYPCLFPFFLYSSFFLSLLPFPVFPFLFVSSFSVGFLHRLLRFSFRFHALLGGGFCSFVSVLHPPRAACEPDSLRIPPVCCLLSCV